MGHRAQGTVRKVDFKMFIVYTPCGIHPSDTQLVAKGGIMGYLFVAWDLNNNHHHRIALSFHRKSFNCWANNPAFPPVALILNMNNT